MPEILPGSTVAVRRDSSRAPILSRASNMEGLTGRQRNSLAPARSAEIISDGSATSWTATTNGVSSPRRTYVIHSAAGFEARESSAKRTSGFSRSTALAISKGTAAAGNSKT
jgi:hypothetical protein